MSNTNDICPKCKNLGRYIQSVREKEVSSVTINAPIPINPPPVKTIIKFCDCSIGVSEELMAINDLDPDFRRGREEFFQNNCEYDF